jgi:hypothetical protein
MQQAVAIHRRIEQRPQAIAARPGFGDPAAGLVKLALRLAGSELLAINTGGELGALRGEAGQRGALLFAQQFQLAVQLLDVRPQLDQAIGQRIDGLGG